MPDNTLQRRTSCSNDQTSQSGASSRLLFTAPGGVFVWTIEASTFCEILEAVVADD